MPVYATSVIFGVFAVLAFFTGIYQLDNTFFQPCRCTIPKAIKKVLATPLLVLATNGLRQEDTRRQVNICHGYLLCRSKSSTELMLSVSKSDVK